MAKTEDKRTDEKHTEEQRPRQRAVLFTTMSPYFYFDRGVVEPVADAKKGGK